MIVLLGSMTAPASAQDAPATVESTESSTTANPMEGLAFLTGIWRGAWQGNATVEETWSQPMGRSMIGMLRIVDASGTPTMHELTTITHENDQIILRIRHADSQLNFWPLEREPGPLVLIEIDTNVAVFASEDPNAGLQQVIYAVENDRVTVTLTMQDDQTFAIPMDRVVDGD